MSGRVCKGLLVKVMTWSAILLGSWICLDFFANLDEFLETAGADRNWFAVAFGHYWVAFLERGPALVSSVGLASLAIGGLSAWCASRFPSRLAR